MRHLAESYLRRFSRSADPERLHPRGARPARRSAAGAVFWLVLALAARGKSLILPA